MVWIYLAQLFAGFCDHVNEAWGTLKVREFRNYLSDY